MEKAIELVTKATEEDKNKNYEQALAYYERGVQYFLHSLRYEVHGDKAKDSIREKCLSYIERAEKLKTYLAKKKGDGPQNSDTYKDGNEKSKKPEASISSEDGEKAKMQSQLQDAIITRLPPLSWSDVAGLEEAKLSLQEAVIAPIKLPSLFKGKREPWKGILLYGPPGTGKSFLAKVVAAEAKNSTFFSISASDLVSKWLGESEKMVKQLFELARERTPSIIFIDEVDSLCSARNENDSEASTRIKNEFLVQMDGVGTNNDGLLVLGATNHPWLLDQAFRRRFKRKIHIPLPDKAARLQMFKLELGDTPHDISESDLIKMAEKTKGFSGDDIRTAVSGALMKPIRKLLIATHFRKVSCPSKDNPDDMVDLYEPCSPGVPGAIEMSWTELKDGQTTDQQTTVDDMMLALDSSKRSVNEEDLIKVNKFTEEFGMEG